MSYTLMRHSLLSRFRGLLLGAILGEGYPYFDPQLSGLLGNAQWDRAIAEPSPDHKLPLSRAIIASSMAVIQAQIHAPIATPTDESVAQPLGSLGPAEAIASLLPVALFFHDNLTQLQQQMRQALPPSSAPEVVTAADLVALAIALVLREQRQPYKLIPHLLETIDDPAPTLTDSIRQVQDLLIARAGLTTAIKELAPGQSALTPNLSTATALAFYCWLSTADQFHLSLSRAYQIKHSYPLTGVLTGALSGVYNAQTGIPPAWQIQLRHLPVQSPIGSQSFTQTNVVQLADQLLAVWSGCYQPLESQLDQSQFKQAAIAAPGLIRPR